MFTRPKGTRDFLPKEMKKRRIVEEKLRRVFESYNFREILTPTFESFQLLSRKTGEEIRRQLFVFRDHGGREMGLRPEITSSVVRLYLNELKNYPKPIKLYYFANCFRYENPQAGRYREFWQMGCELIGSKYPIADGEVINLAMDGLDAVGVDYETHIGHLGVLKGIFQKFNLSEEEELNIRRLIDKEDYKGLRDYLESIESSQELREIVFTLLKFKGEREVLGEVREVLRDYPLSLQALRNLEEILEFVKKEDVVINFGIARGLDYYTGMVFEIYGKRGGAKQVCGGGRYDNLIELFGGEPTPAVGFAYGFDRIMMNIPDFEVEEEVILVVPVKKDINLLKKSMEIADELRRRGKVVEVDLMYRRLNKALNYANTMGIRKVIIVGERELEQGMVLLRDMRTGEQIGVKLEELGEYV
ncbi:histidine--tRNA ligase [Methanothermococcus sp. SCGC AD-155-E23]|nr:histidine--tRNA ligase [Methanothermococcus sp. SCGC AD-155-E23]